MILRAAPVSLCLQPTRMDVSVLAGPFGWLRKPHLADWGCVSESVWFLRIRALLGWFKGKPKGKPNPLSFVFFGVGGWVSYFMYIYIY